MLMAHFAHMRVLTCAGTCTCATCSLQAAALIHWSLLVCVMQENNFACFYVFSLFGLLLNNVSTSQSFDPAADCWAVRRPLPADYGRPWCIRSGQISSIACTAFVKDCCNCRSCSIQCQKTCRVISSIACTASVRNCCNCRSCSIYCQRYV